MRFALIGTGNIAGTYVSALTNVESASLTAIVSRDQQRATDFAASHGIEHAACSLQEVVEFCDAVCVATPNGLHGVQAAEVAQFGLHVLVDKPLDITDEAMTQAIAACRQAGVVLGVTYQRRFRPTNQYLHTALREGSLGLVRAVDLQLKFFRDQAYYDSAAWRGTYALDGGGPFMQQGIHDIDLLCWLFGMPESVTAECSNLAHPGLEVEDHGVAICRYGNGALASITASTALAPGFSPRMEVFTDKGYFVCANDEIVEWDIAGVAQPELVSASSQHNSAHSASVSDTSGHEAAILELIHAAAENRPHCISGESAREATDLILAVYASSRKGCRVVL